MYEIINEEQQLKDFDYKKITPETLGLKATNDFALYANEKIVNEMPEESKQWVSKGPIGVLEAGKMYADEMNEFDGTYVNIKPEKEQGAWSNSVDERIARNFEKKAQRDERVNQGTASFFDRAGAFLDRVGDESLRAQKEQAQKVQDRQMPNKDNANYRYELKGVDKAGQPIFNEIDLREKIDFAEALSDSIASGEYLPYVGSQIKRHNKKRLLDIKEKIKNNEQITQEELNYFNRFKDREYEKQLRGYTIGGEIGANWLPSMLAFGGEIAVGGWILKGIGLAGKGISAGSKLTNLLLKSGKVNKTVAGALGFSAGQIAEGGLNALVGGSVAGLSGGFWANYNERKLNDTMKITDRGTVVFREASETPAKAFVKSMASLYISYFAESMGSLLGAPFKAGSKLIGNTSVQAFKKVLENCPKLEGFIKKSAPLLAKAYEKLNNLPIKGKSAEWLKNQVKFDGFLEEIGEELLEEVMTLTAGINNEERSLENYIKVFHKSPEEWAVLTGMIALQGTTLSVAGNLVGHIMQNNGVEDEKILETLSNTTEAERLDLIGEAIENGSLNVSEIKSEETKANDFRQAMEKEAYDKFIAFGVNEKQAAATAMLHGVQAMNLLKEGNSEEDIRKQLSFELTNKTVEEITKGAQALNQKDLEYAKAKYTKTDKVYDNFVQLHTENNLVEKVPEYWQGETVEEALEYLGIKDNKGVKIKSPIEEVSIYKSHMEHLINDNNAHRKKYLNRAIRTIQEPNLITKSGNYHNYIKLFSDGKNTKPHLQIVKVKEDGNFYVTTLKPSKAQFKSRIIEGQVIYDLSSMSSENITDNPIITNSQGDFNPDVKNHKDVLYQTNENQQEPLMAGFTAQEIFERLQALYDEYGDFTNDTPKEVFDNQSIKIEVLKEALEYMFKENRIQKDFDEIAYNTYHVMNNAPLPEAFVEANKNTERTIREYEEIVRAKKEKKENEYLGYYINQDNTNIIGLAKKADVSTLPHELAHLYLNAMNELAKTNVKTKERLDEVNKWLGYDGNSYSVAQQEKFAIGYEAYLYNGKAPNSILKEVFENFKEWLKSTYTYIRTQSIEFNSEAEAIFDKMFGADNFIQKQKASEDLLKRIKEKSVSKKKKANIKKEEKPSEYSQKYKNTAYAILETATGKNKKYLKSILETESNMQSIAKKREKLLREIEEVADNITINGFDPAWGEFFTFRANEDYTLAKEAFEVILNKTYLNVDKLLIYENDYAESIRESIDETDIEYKKLLSAYKKGNRDVALATYYDWIETINPEIKRDYEERFYNDSRNIDKIENQSDIAKAKEKIIKRAFEVENRYGINSDTGYIEMVKQTLGSLKFLTPVDKARIATNILDVSTLDILLGRVDSILDIAETMQDISYRNKLSQDIHKELQLTKNVKKGARTVGKYDYRTNKIFEQLREIDRLSQEQAQELKQNMADIIRKKEEGELSYEDILINKFIKYKADGRTYADSELMKSIYDEILKIKLIGKTAKNEQELQDRINGSKEIEELTKIVSNKKKGNFAIKAYIQTMGNFETLMHAFFNKKVAQEYADELLYAETEAQVFQNEQKQKFQRAVAKIYNLPLWNFDKEIINFLGTKFEYDEYRREYDKDRNLIKTRTFKKELTKMDLILAYMWSRNDTLKARLINQFGEQQIDNMIGQLDNKDIQFANLMMSTAQSFYPLVNQAYIKKYGFDLPRVSCYFPSTPERGTELDMFNDYGARSKNDSFSKQRAVSEIVPMEFGNPVAILYNHIDGVAKFAIIGTQIDKANTILNNQTFLKPAIINTYGKDAYRTLQQTLLNVTYKAESQVYNGFSKVINALTSNWIQANIAFKPLVAIKQFISANNYASIMPAGEWVLRFGQSAIDWKNTINYMWNISYVRARYQGSYTNEFLKSTVENSAFAVTGKLKDFMAMNVKLGDLGSLVFGGKPYIDYLISQGKTEQEAIKQFVIETNKMQQSSAVSSLSNFQIWATRQSLARPFTAYRNSQQQYARKCGDAIIQYCNGDIAKGEMCKTIFHFMFLQPFIFALFTSGSLVTLAITGDDDDLKEDVILSLSNLCIDAVPILHDMYLHAMKKLVLHDYSPVNTLPLWGDIEKEISRLAKEDVPLTDYLYSLGYILGNVGTGVNITTVGNAIGGMGDIVTDDWLKGVLRLVGYSDFRAGRMTGEAPKKKKKKIL